MKMIKHHSILINADCTLYTDLELIPLEPINIKRESIRTRARERYHIEKAQTMQPQGINREDNC